jgi:hypothetical protein
VDKVIVIPANPDHPIKTLLVDEAVPLIEQAHAALVATDLTYSFTQQRTDTGGVVMAYAEESEEPVNPRAQHLDGDTDVIHGAVLLLCSPDEATGLSELTGWPTPAVDELVAVLSEWLDVAVV